MPSLNFWKIAQGINLTPKASAPSSPTNGDIYYNSTTNLFQFYQNGAFVGFTDGTGFLKADGSVPLTAAWNTGNFQIKHGDGTVSLPSITFNSDPDTGLYRIGANNVGATANGALVWQWDTTGITLNSTSAIYNTDGTGAAPSYTFNADGNTGMYRESADKIAWSAGGTRRMALSDSFLFADVPVRLLSTGGSVSVPALMWDSDADTGLYNPSANVLGFVTGGAEIGRFTSTALSLTGILQVAGSTSTDYLISAGSGSAQTLLSGTNQTGLLLNLLANSSATGQVNGALINVKTANSSFTVPEASGIKFNTWTRGASSTITTGMWIQLGAAIDATNSAQIADNITFTGTYFLNSSTTNPSVLTGRLALGGTESTSAMLNVSNTLTGALQIGVRVQDFIATSAATTSAHGISANCGTANASFTVPILSHFRSTPRAKGAASTVTNAIGFFQSGDMTNVGATNSAIFADNSSFTGNWAVNVTITNPWGIAGRMNLGANTPADFDATVLYIATSAGRTTGTTQYGIYQENTANSTATTAVYGIQSTVKTQNASFTTATAAAIRAFGADKGASNTITRLMAIYTDAPSVGTNNCSIGDNNSFTGNFFLNSNSGYASSLNGALAHQRADVASTATISALSSTNGFVRLTGSTATDLQGITAGIDGQVLRLFNNSGQTLTIRNESGSATAANRITTMTGADITTTGNGFAEFIYDTGTSRWIAMYVTA